MYTLSTLLHHYNATCACVVEIISDMQVSLWSPNVTSPLVKIMAHKGPVTALALDPTGKYLVPPALILTKGHMLLCICYPCIYLNQGPHPPMHFAISYF